jgi:hypothetical protein
VIYRLEWPDKHLQLNHLSHRRWHHIGTYGAGKSYVVFGKQDNIAINLSDIVAGQSRLCQRQWLIN